MFTTNQSYGHDFMRQMLFELYFVVFADCESSSHSASNFRSYKEISGRNLHMKKYRAIGSNLPQVEWKVMSIQISYEQKQR
uniref:Uncharacterized protein n=1 Tax=Spironucleus salmonicida TaxID=348837 RepID=V6LQQ3_9EUKA|eukprot:EST43084.1 Hypothetical protein SS50377_17241 [Spironucleus salmonicida]